MKSPHLLLFVAAMFLSACGGGEKPTEKPTQGDTEEAHDAEGDVSVPPETIDEIERLFSRRSAQISRCYIAGVEADEIEKDKGGVVTIQLTIGTSGKATNIELVKNAFQSAAMKACIVEQISEWDFPSVPKALPYSHAYKLGSL